MKTIRIMLLFTAMLFCLVNQADSQELSKMFNSSKALRLEAKIAQFRSRWEQLNEEYTRIYEQLKKMRSSNGSSSISGQEKSKLLKKQDSLMMAWESVSEILRKLRVEHSKEILKTKESQAVLKKMQEAVKAGDSPTAHEVMGEYLNSLREDVAEKFRLKQINFETYQAERKATFKMYSALECLAFPPVKITHVFNDRW